jgi:hypothetical protein
MQAEIDAARVRLDQIPDGITFADLPLGASPAEVRNLPGDLGDLLLVSDGPRCQTIVVYPSHAVQGLQYLCEDLAGGAERWFCFGHVEDNPLLIERDSGHVYQFPHPVAMWRISDKLECLAESVVEFFTHYALGERYLSVAPQGGRWYDFLRGASGEVSAPSMQ